MGLSLNSKHLKRYKDLAVLFYKYGSSDLVKYAGLEQALVDDEKQKDIKGKIEELPKELEKLGPTYVKLGQFLSTRSDLLPLQYLEVLERLQDNVKPFPYSQVEEIINKEIPMRFSKAFMEFDIEPLAAASIGQVHKAVLRDGKNVAVKIQRPNIREEIIEDLDAFRDVAEFLQSHTEMGKEFAPDMVLEEFRKAILRELDFRNEEQNLKLISENLKEFQEIIIPCPVDDYCTSKIITMDYISGTKVTAISPLKKLDIDGKRLAEVLFKAYMKQILIDGFYHCDPHPGNVFVTDDNRIALLDLGMTGYVSTEMQINLLHILLAIGDGRGDEVAEYSMKIGNKSDFFEPKKFKSELSELISRTQVTTLKDLEIGRTILELNKICGKNGIHIPNELAMLGKTLLNLDKVGKTLDPDFNPNESIKRNANEMMKKKFQQSATSQKPYEILLEAKEFFEKLPFRVNRIMDKIDGNELEVKVNAIDEPYLMNGFQKIANRITMGLILAALIIGAAMMMRIETSFTILGYPGLAMIFFLIAALFGITLMFRIIFADEVNVKKRPKN